MRYPTGDLAILSAESYSDGRVRQLRSAIVKTKKSRTALAIEDAEGAPARKRRKTASPDAAGEEEEKKRSRGRPRLEPKDETAQDRRRTQIRLAQRAYRNRKENAIQTLERRVQELKDTNEAMNNAFLRLHDYAVDSGLLDRMPDVGRQLRETTQKFLSLARKHDDDADHDEDDEHSVSHPDSQPAAKRGRPRTKSSSPEVVEVERTSEPPEPRPPQLMGGLIVTQEHGPLPELDPSLTSSEITSMPQHLAMPQYEVITYPTLDNASFPFGFPSDDFSFATPDDLAAIQPAGPDFSDLASPSLYPSLPLPSSFSANEVTFGRRFGRTALERAWNLVTMPDPPAKPFSRVFGFCLLFEPLESIRARLRMGLDRAGTESLHNWQYPFLNLGASGTHFDTAAAGLQRFGNQGLTDVMRTKNDNGFSMGPFDAKTNAARDTLGVGQYLPPGSALFGAELYDSDEIEMYLHQRGVTIPAGADFVTVEVDPEAFADEELGQGVASAGVGGGLGGSSTVNPLDMFARDSSSGSGPASSDARSATSSGGSSGADTSVTVPGDFSQEMWRFDGTEVFLKGTGGTPGLGKKQMTVDVNMLIFEMVERATCLGRSPGLRKQDINDAFWTATRNSNS